jgi:hypothetical protein
LVGTFLDGVAWTDSAEGFAPRLSTPNGSCVFLPGLSAIDRHMHPLESFGHRQGWDAAQLDAYAETITALYRDELSTRTIADRVGLVSHTEIARQLRALGIALRPRGKRTQPPPTCRRCGLEAPPGRIYCSPACCAAGRCKHPQPEPRPCEHCGRLFTPEAHKLARGAGRFCKYKCWNAYRRGKPQREWRAR